MNPVRIHKVFVSPNGREKVELFGPKSGLYGLRLCRRDGDMWRPTIDNCRHDSYARAVVEAAKQVEWLGVEHLRQKRIGD